MTKQREFEFVRKEDKWHDGANILRCPFPGCLHSAYVITKVHCRLEHEMERDEVEKLYGVPKRSRRK